MNAPGTPPRNAPVRTARIAGAWLSAVLALGAYKYVTWNAGGPLWPRLNIPETAAAAALLFMFAVQFAYALVLTRQWRAGRRSGPQR